VHNEPHGNLHAKSGILELAIHRVTMLRAAMVQDVQRNGGSGHRMPVRRASLRVRSGILAVLVLFLLVAPACSEASVAERGPAVSGGSGQQGPLVAATAVRLPGLVPCESCWYPPVQESWQIQLSSTPAAPFLHVRMIEVDGFGTPASTVAALHRSMPGRGVVCYIDAGTWENWRPDAGEFPKYLLGLKDGSWPGERWLDIARFNGVLAAIMRARAEMCKNKGFNAVDFDNVDAYANDTGFHLTAGNQLAYDVFLANTAHSLGLSVGLKNDIEQIPELLPYFDFAVDEQCFRYADCLTSQNGGMYGLNEFVAAGKAVFDIEYQIKPSQFCPAATRDRINALVKQLSLGAWRVAC
jgi:endo-alpha-1,4-polygalactosaminidase (GH114 family)